MVGWNFSRFMKDKIDLFALKQDIKYGYYPTPEFLLRLINYIDQALEEEGKKSYQQAQEDSKHNWDEGYENGYKEGRNDLKEELKNL